MPAFSILFGGAAVIGLFFGQILLLAWLFDKWNDRAKAIEAANPGLARLKADLLVRRLGVAALRSIHTVAWLSGLVVLPSLFVIVHGRSWIMLPAVLALTFVQLLVCDWTSRNLAALNGGLAFHSISHNANSAGDKPSAMFLCR